jgi:hypothetical protein
MANTYDVIKDYGLQPGAQYVSSNSHWLMCVFRLKYPTTYDRNLKSSFSKTYSDAVEIRGEPLIITDDVVQLSVSSTKTSYLMQAQCQMLDSGTNYLAEIFPGDYVMFWMVNNKETYLDLIKRLKSFSGQAGQAVNKFSDGLKFTGRVQSLRKAINQSPNGVRTSRYNLTAISFNEFDAQVFYEPHLAEKEPAIGNYFGRLTASLNQLISTKGQGIDVNKAIPIFLDLLLGRGIAPNFGRGNNDPRLQSTVGLTASYSYILPGIVGQALGKTQTSTTGGLLTYADVLECIIGIQQYSNDNFSEETKVFLGNDGPVDLDTLQVSHNFAPDGTRTGGSRRFAGDMLGEFLPQVPHFFNKNVWTILQQYLNPAVNEMFTCLRVNPDGLVVPTMIVRQLPFTSKFLRTDLNVTRFLELPRWGIDPVLVHSADFGRSDSLRFNFVHVYGDTVDHSAPFAAQIVRNVPIRDDLDIARSGLRPHMQTIPCAPADTRNGSPAKWMELTSDILMGQQLTLTGTLSVMGIQSPICPGDNIEWDGVVFHIESVSHSCGIQIDGQKQFQTTLALTHGVRSNPGLEDITIYAGVKRDDQLGYNPGVTSVNENQKHDTLQRPGPSLQAGDISQDIDGGTFT